MKSKSKPKVATLQHQYKTGDLVEVVSSNHSGLVPKDRGIMKSPTFSGFGVEFTKSFEVFHNGCWTRKTQTRTIHLTADEIKPCKL